MSTKLKKRHAGALLAGLATLSIAILAALLPGWGEAQEVDTNAVSIETAQATNNQTNAAADEATTVATSMVTTSQGAYEPTAPLVVEPGDSLWAIAQEQLRPGATPQQVAEETGRIYGLNHQRIGDDPNLIFPGQELLLAQGPERAANAPTTVSAAPSDPAATAERPKSDEAVLLEPDDEPAPEPATSEPAAEDDPTADNVEPFYPDGRMLPLLVLLGFFLFALAVAVFGARKLLTTRRLLVNRYEHPYENKSLGGAPVWVSCPYPTVTLGLEKMLGEKVRVYGGRRPPARDAPSSIVFCPGEEDVASEMRDIRSLAPDAPILVLGPRVDTRLAQTALLAGAHGFIHLGMQPAQIVRALSAVSEGYAVVPKELLEFFLEEMLSCKDRADLDPDQREFLELVATSAVSSRDEIVVPRKLLEAFFLEGNGNGLAAVRKTSLKVGR